MAKKKKRKILVSGRKSARKHKSRKEILKSLDKKNKTKGKSKKLKGWRKYRKYLGYGALAVFLIIAVTFAWFSKDLPTAGKIMSREVEQSTRILDRKGNLLYKIHGEKNRTLIDFEEMPDYVKNATIAIEDKHYYKHMGVDVMGVFRAVWVNVSKRGYYQGGSTLTQQLVKNALLSPKKTFTRKIKELILSVEMEVMYSKDEILGMYLNEIPYGSNAYGIEAASQAFYGKHAKDLGLSEAATLASLPRAPSYYSPYGSHTDVLKARRNLVLDQMVNQGYIDQKKADRAKKQKLTFSAKRDSIKAPHFVMYVKELIANEYGERMIEEGGLTITTTLDQKLQKFANQAVTQGVNRNKAAYGGNNAALTAVNPSTGQILAMVGSKDFFDIENDGNVNVALRERQPGSSFKPVVYATLLKGNWSPGSTLFDVRTDFGSDYRPKNYDGTTRGPVSIRTALSNSLNIPAVKALYLAGMDESIATASAMGINTLTEPERYGLSLVLGGGEVKLLELTSAYAVFANKGVKAEVSPILKVEDSSGKTLQDNTQPRESRVLKKEIAYEISDILSDTQARQATFGFSPNMSLPDRRVAVKTGTTNDYRDAWTMGYTPNIAAGVWAGNNDNSAMRGEASGSVVAAPIWHQFMASATRKYSVKNFNRPANISDISIAKLSNKKATNDSWETTNDIATDWQTPEEYDNTFQKVRIDRVSGKLATKYCPADQVKKQVYGVVHSEVPENSNWESPVRAWAKAKGIASYPPTEKCDIHTPGNQPSASISSPSDGESVSGFNIISASINAPLGVKRVQFFIDNNLVRTDTSSPYQVGYNFNNLDPGLHNISVTLTDQGSLTSTSQISVTVAAVEGEDTEENEEAPDETLLFSFNRILDLIYS